MPFADYQVTRVSLDEFQETSGAFPARFDAVRDTTHLTQLGVEGNVSATERLKLWATASWGHRFDDRAPGVSGVIIPLSSPVGVQGVGVVGDWAESRVGLSWSPLERTFVELSGRVSNGGIVANDRALEGGVSLRLSTAFN
jgi:uncharacterized protein with beta-barrel porin domain